MKKIVLILLNIFIAITCFSQVKSNEAELERLELQLGTIQGVLKTLYHANPYGGSDDDERLSYAFEQYRDSLQASFYSILKQICSIDTAMEYEFPLLGKYVDVVKSLDNKVRIFSRDTYTGGTAPVLCSYIQYVSGDSTKIEYMPIMGPDSKYDPEDMGLYYDKIYTFPYKGETYYLAAGYTKLSTASVCSDLRALSISNDYIKNKPIFKTGNNTTDYLRIRYYKDNCNYAEGMYLSSYPYPRIIFDETEKIVLKPDKSLDDESILEETQGKVITYKWENGLFVEYPAKEGKK